MRLLRPAIGLLLLALSLVALAACSSGEAGWTYAPPPSTTPAPSAVASGEPSTAPGSPAATADASAAPSAQPGGELVQVSAVNIAFEQATLTVPADVPLQIEFANNDASVPHNIQIKDQGGAEVFITDTFPGVETRTFDAPALPAGTYQWICTLHPNMVIQVTAE